MIAHSYFSLRYGTVAPLEAMHTLRDAGYEAAIFADINNTSATWDIKRWSKQNDFPVVVGVDFKNKMSTQYIAIPKSESGWAQINEWLSYHSHRKMDFPARPPHWDAVEIIYPFERIRDWNAEMLRDNEWIGLAPHEWNRCRISRWAQSDRLLAMPVFSFRNKKDFNTHRLLRSIEENQLLSKLSILDQAPQSEILLPSDQVRQAYEEGVLYDNTVAWIKERWMMWSMEEEVSLKNQSVFGKDEETDFILLRDLALEGLSYRYPELDAQDLNHPILQRLEKELSVIQEKNYVSYFLINWDITSYARNNGYFYVGRGSGANSIIAYLLRITDVDPIELDLYFERFINLYRQNPPDFDIDFSWTDREDMTQYIFSRFPNVTLLGAYNTFQFRAAVRELGKVFGLPKEDIDLLSDGKFRVEELDELQRLTLRYAQYIQDFPNALSIHAAGILITQKPIHHYTATFLPPKGFPTTHFDMVVAEDIGIYKFDILSQRGLGKIKECVEIIAYNQPDKMNFDIHDIRRFKQDEQVRSLIRSADAIGCFYVESPAMRMLLGKLQVDDYLGLVAASSVIRPGVSKSGMMREFIMRQRIPERRKQAHPVLLDLMPETYGIMVYQEDVIKVAHYYGGLTLGEADALRRGMSGKFRGREEFEKARDQFVQNALQKGHPLEEIIEIWRQIESFAGYAFAKGHSASYAVESFQSLFLKAYFPLEYMVATLNNGGGFYSVEFYVHEARRKGAQVEPPCVQRSSAVSLIRDRTIFLGLGMIKDLEHPVIERILQAQRKGEFKDFDDFIDRIHLGLEQCILLIRAGAFRFTNETKKSLLWKAQIYFNQRSTDSSATLFGVQRKEFSIPQLEHHPLEDIYDQMELLGFPLCNPFDWIGESLEPHVLSREIPNHLGKLVVVYGYYITAKSTRTAKGERMYFGNFIDQEGNFIDSVHFPNAQGNNIQWRGQGVYWMRGKVIEEMGVYNVEVYEMRKVANQEDPRYSELRAAEKTKRGRK
jgi:DNA polymerase-3 subunit alpha